MGFGQVFVSRRDLRSGQIYAENSIAVTVDERHADCVGSIPYSNVNYVDRGNQVRAEMAADLALLGLQIKIVAATRGSSGRNLAMDLKNASAGEDCRRNIVDANKFRPD